MFTTRLVHTLAAAALFGALIAAPAVEARRGGKRASAPREPELSQAEKDISTAVRSQKVPNGGMVWGVDRPGPFATAALVVRGGARQEDLDMSGVATATARWTLEGFAAAELARSGTVVEFDMLPGGAVFVLRGESNALPGASSRLLRAVLKPDRSQLARSRDRAALELRRHDLLRSVPDLIGALCWTGSSFELPTYGQLETLTTVDDKAELLFHSVWYRPRNMTLIALAPGGIGSYVGVMKGAAGGKMSRETIAPGQPGLPIHQVQKGHDTLNVAGVAMPGPQNPAGALLLRVRAEELLAEAQAAGRINGPATVDIVWTKTTAIVHAAAFHPPALGTPSETEQATQLKDLEAILASAGRLSEPEINELRKREGMRLSRRFSTPEGALSLLAPLATVVDTPVDVRKAVMATPTPQVRAALDQSADDNAHLSLRRRREGP